MDTEKLAAQIEADRKERAARARYVAAECVACGRGHSREDGFCHDRCAEWIARGERPYELLRLEKYYSLPMGPEGFYIHCAHCQSRFDSKGLRCCSPECERAFVRQEVCAVKAGPFRAHRRGCEAPGCSADIPLWKNGRRVKSNQRYCSERCWTRAKRAA